MAWTNIDTPSTPVIAATEPFKWDLVGDYWDVSGVTWDDNTPAWSNVDTATAPTWS